MSAASGNGAERERDQGQRPIVRLESDELSAGPWVFARNVAPAAGVEDGALVEVRDRSDRFLGHALYNSASDITLRWLSRGRRAELDRLTSLDRMLYRLARGHWRARRGR